MRIFERTMQNTWILTPNSRSRRRYHQFSKMVTRTNCSSWTTDRVYTNQFRIIETIGRAVISPYVAAHMANWKIFEK